MMSDLTPEFDRFSDEAARVLSDSGGGDLGQMPAVVVLKMQQAVASAIREAVAAEREACALLCDEIKYGTSAGYSLACEDAAYLIRARAQKEKPDA